MSRRVAVGTIGTLLLLGGCATHPAAPPVAIEAPERWDNAEAAVQPGPVEERWWVKLGDPVIDRLIEAALSDNPTLAQALARVDQARAILDAGRAARLPRADVSGSISYGQQNLGTAGGVNLVDATAASISPGLSWELDLWGRVRETARAARSRLDARTADARDARLSIAAQLAAGVLRLRACDYGLGLRVQDIVSRGTELDLMRRRLAFGAVAPVDVASASSNLASAEIDRISQTEECVREVDALVAISGVDAATIRSLLPGPPIPDADGTTAPSAAPEADIAAIIPAAPPMRLALPATVLLNHPTVAAAEREVMARWSEIGVAQAERMPRIDLAAILTGQWLRALGTTTSVTTWSAGPQLSGTIFDGGAGAANVRNAEARYREAVAMLQAAVRTAVQGIEDGLAAQQSAQQRMETARDAVTAARFALTANEARWRAGAISLFELEDARRQFNRAQQSAVEAARDHAEAWVELIRASGNGFDLASASPDGVPPPSPLPAPQSQPQ